MANHAEQLSIRSSKEEVGKAVTECVAQKVAEGMAQDQAVAACHAMARKSTGQPLQART